MNACVPKLLWERILRAKRESPRKHVSEARTKTYTMIYRILSANLGWCVLLAFCAAMGVVAADPAPPAVRHPNLLLNQQEIDHVKLKVRDYPWAARLLDRVKAKAEKDGAAVETALAYVLTGQTNYARNVRSRLLNDAREYMRHYGKLDIRAEPEWGRWTHWGAIAWAYDLTYDAFTSEERAELERWLRTAARTIIAQEKILTTTPNLVFCEHWRVGMIGYCLGDRDLIDWALNDPGHHGPSRGGFYPIMDTMIRDEHFWAEAPIYALHYDVHGMFALAEAALRHDGTDLHKYVSPRSGASLKKLWMAICEWHSRWSEAVQRVERSAWPRSVTDQLVF